MNLRLGHWALIGITLGFLATGAHASPRGTTCELAHADSTEALRNEEGLLLKVFIDVKNGTVNTDGNIWGNHYGIRSLDFIIVNGAPAAVGIGYHFGSRYRVDFRSNTVRTPADITSGTVMQIGDAFGESRSREIPAFGKYAAFTLVNCH